MTQESLGTNRIAKNVGNAFDFAINGGGMKGQDFASLFASSAISNRLEAGEPALAYGKSGIELAQTVLSDTFGKEIDGSSYARVSATKEYWIGYALAFYQILSGRRYTEILEALPYGDIESLYSTLHEADISKFVEIAESKMNSLSKKTSLKRLRDAYGCSQSDLARMANVNRRSIQMYEQRRKDINKAGADTLYRLAKALGCRIEDLLESESNKE